jgi:hypothetical protein
VTLVYKDAEIDEESRIACHSYHLQFQVRAGLDVILKKSALGTDATHMNRQQSYSSFPCKQLLVLLSVT